MEERQGLPVAGERRLDAAAGVEHQALVVAQIGLGIGQPEPAREIEPAGESLVGRVQLAHLP